MGVAMCVNAPARPRHPLRAMRKDDAGPLIEGGAVRTRAVSALGFTRRDRFGFLASARADHAWRGEKLLQILPVALRTRRGPAGGDERLEMPAAPAARVF